jgi:hypothetical protein
MTENELFKIQFSEKKQELCGFVGKIKTASWD